MAELVSHGLDSDMEYELDLDTYADFDYDAFVRKFSDVDIKPRNTKREIACHTIQPAPPEGLVAPKKQRTQLRPLPHEVLSAIFSFLPQATLRTCASLVCKDWARVCQFVVRRVGVWRVLGEDGHLELLNQMPKINTLVCWILQDPELQPEYWTSIDPNSALKMWNKFVRAVTEPLPSRGLKKVKNCLLDNIKEIVIHGNYISYKRVIAPLLPHLQYLRILRLDFQRDNASMDLFPILDHCLNLKELTIKGAINRFLLVRADGEDQELEIANVPEPPPKEELESYIHENQPTTIYPQRYGILCIVLHEVVISQRTLERIIVTCPLMRTLKATEMKKYRPVPSRPGSLQPVHLDRGRIVRLVRDYCPYMEWLALIQSLEPEQVWNTTVRPIKQGYDSRPPPPVLYEWFVAKETRYLSACMEALTFDGTRYYRRARDLLGYLTILEITDALVLQEVHLLSQLLSLTPCLEHFRAARARLYITDLRQKNWVHEYKTNRERRMIAKEKGRKDLSPAHQASRRNVMEYVQSVRESKVAMHMSDYWRCLNLRSLDLGIYGDAPNTSRLFTYLWLHCPVLRHLCIRCESVQMGQLIQYPEHGSRDLAWTNSDDWAVQRALPQRFPNHLQDLRGLELLETVRIYTDSIRGILAGSDFEFLRRPLDMRSQDQRQYEQRAAKHAPRGAKEVAGTIYEDDEGDDDTAVVLPFLTSVVFVYRSSPMKEDYRDVVEALEEIRPGVEFKFIERFTTDESI
ncbi:MAG: hypothetical protein BYD32DRAFT_417816 [Podila humilis]|nr:MAG: hypothetical protein BYD32DRAFT_417816 [Podila humilis]